MRTNKLTVVKKHMYYTKDTVLFLNGKFIKAVDAHTDLYSQSLHYGMGVFEGIRAYETQYETDELIQIAYQLLEKNELSDAYLRPLVYCGPNMQLTHTSEVYLMMCAWRWEKYHGEKQLKLCVSSYQRPNPNSLKMEAKVTGHYVNSILATSEAKVRGYDEALMLDMHGNVAEAPGANFFMEKNGVLYTPSLGHILPGITRQTVMNICREL